MPEEHNDYKQNELQNTSSFNINPQKEEKELVKLIPPDGGWGWVVCFASFVISVQLASVSGVFSILFSGLLLDLGASSTLTAWIFNIHAWIWHISGLLAGPLTDKFGWRGVAMFGCFLCSLSIILSAFALNAEFLFFTFSFLGGMGGGLSTTISILVTPCYFDKRRGLATSVLVSGVSVGQFVAPLIVKSLLGEYGFFGSCLIYGALILNACVASTLFHPLEWHAKKPEEAKQMITNNKVNKLQKNTSFHRRLSMTHPSVGSICYSSLSSIPARCNNLEDNVKIDKNVTKTQKKKSNGVCEIIADIIAEVGRSVLEYLRILRFIRVIIISLGMSFFVSGYINFLMLIPFVLQKKGFSLEDSAWAVSAAAIFNFIFRFTTSTISDHPKFNKRLCYMLGAFIAGVAASVFPFLQNYTYLMITVCVWGTGLGLNMGLYSLVMIDVMGLPLFPKVIGASCLVVSFIFLIVGPLVGLVRDYSGNFKLSCFILSGCQIMTFILWTLMPLAVRTDQARDKKRENSEGR